MDSSENHRFRARAGARGRANGVGGAGENGCGRANGVVDTGSIRARVREWRGRTTIAASKNESREGGRGKGKPFPRVEGEG